MIIPQAYAQYIRSLIGEVGNADQCMEYIDRALMLSTHLVRARSVSRAAGFCAFYARMAEKMGVHEILEGYSTIRGREIHRILGLSTFNMFMDHPTITSDQIKKYAEDYVKNAVEDLKNYIYVEEKIVDASIHLLKRLSGALEKAKWLLNLSKDDPLFPIVEQTLADYHTRIYGAPDLVLENPEKKKAIVVEWKTYHPDKDREHKYNVLSFEIAQVIAYSILEARRLGLKSFREIFESIAGVEIKNIKELSNRRFQISLDKIRTSGLLKVLPIIVTPSGGYPPHPFMYKRTTYDDILKRFVKLYKTFRGLIVSAAFLTIQIINIPRLLSEVLSVDAEVVDQTLKTVCMTNKGFVAYSYTPFEFLNVGKPGRWSKYPCIACPFKGDDGPCYFYFGNRKPKDYFDKLMWWARHRVYWEREKDLMSHRAMYELFKDPTLVNLVLSNEPSEIEVTIGNAPRVSRRRTVIYLVKVKRSRDIGRFRFDLFNVSDSRFDIENNIIELTRKIRSVEIDKGVIGFLRKSVYLSLLEPERTINPLLSINAFVMVDEAFISDDRVVYKFYNPSPSLQYKFTIFGLYLEKYKQMNRKALILAYETPVDLTIMELRAIDSIHRYLKQIAGYTKTQSNTDQHGIDYLSPEDMIKEAEIIKRYLFDTEKTVVHGLYDMMRKRIIDYDGKKDSK